MFHRIFCVTLALFFVLSLFPAAHAAEEFTYSAGMVDLVCPDGWSYEIDDSKIIMSAPDNAISFIFDLLDGDDLEAGLEQAIKEIIQALGPTTFAEPVEGTVNGLDMITFVGNCEAEGVAVVVSLISTPAENALCMYYFGAKAAEEAYGEAIAEVINGIKPSTDDECDECDDCDDEEYYEYDEDGNIDT